MSKEQSRQMIRMSGMFRWHVPTSELYRLCKVKRHMLITMPLKQLCLRMLSSPLSVLADCCFFGELVPVRIILYRCSLAVLNGFREPLSLSCVTCCTGSNGQICFQLIHLQQGLRGRFPEALGLKIYRQERMS